MSYMIKDLGRWELYRPDPLPDGAPDNALFARRVSDKKDWYELARDGQAWTPNAVIATLMPSPSGLIVQAVVRDPDRLFPAGLHLIEILGIDPAIDKPHKLFEQQICDIEAGTFTPQPVNSSLPPLTRRQLRLALLSIGFSAQDIEARIGGIADPQERAEVLIEWQDASSYERDHPLVADIVTALELPPEQIDDLWRWSAER